MNLTLTFLRHTLLLLACLLGLAATAQAQDFPPVPDGPVYDGAAILSTQVEQSLDSRMRQYWEQKSTAIVVATVPSLNGRSIDEFARELFGAWGIGSSKTNRGLLVLIAPNERKARIEVGCGLETVVTDEAAAQIMDEVLVPRFAQGEFDAGAEAGVTALISRVDTANVPAGPATPYCVELMKDAT
ncbi:MAG TPA: TPM domain-containing protein [Erythrobacter sp.]|nr:TPM domain-containing protein [Erythrobacter sp.]